MRAGIQEYVKRLTPFSKWEELEQNEVKMPDNCSPVMKEKILMEEGESLLKHIRDEDYLILLDLKGKEMTSEEFAGCLNDKMLTGTNHFYFMIGGPCGNGKYTEACKSAHIIWQNDIDASDGKTDTLRADLQSHENYSQPALSFVIDNLKTKDKINCGFI